MRCDCNIVAPNYWPLIFNKAMLLWPVYLNKPDKVAFKRLANKPILKGEISMGEEGRYCCRGEGGGVSKFRRDWSLGCRMGGISHYEIYRGIGLGRR